MVKKRILALFCIIIFCITLPVPGIAQRQLVSKAQKIGESDSLILYYLDEPHPNLMIEDKRNGFIWTSFVSDDYYDTDKLNDIWKNNIKSLFTLEYIKLNINNFTPSESSSAELKADITTEKVDNGINIYYDFTDIEIKLELQIRLEDYALSIKVPIDGIEEYGEMGLVSINMLPFLGAANNEEDGYVFYPDGSGAISYFSSNQGPASRHSWHIYGYQEMDLDFTTWLDKVEVYDAALPVFGMKRGHNGFIAIMEEGEYDGIIHYEPSRRPLLLNRIYSQWIYRRTYMATLSNASMLKKMEQEIIPWDKQITYIFLADENADYSGMANAYRQRLLETGRLSSRIEEGEPIPLALNLFMGIKEKRVLLDKFIAMTSFEQGMDIIQRFNDHNIQNMKINLLGWTKDGYGVYPSKINPHRALGGRKGLKQLADYVSSKGYQLFLQDNYIDASKGVRGFSPNKDGVKQRNTLVVSNLYSNSFLYNAQVAFNRLIGKIFPRLNSYDISGIAFDKIGSMIYYDFHDRYPMTRKDTAETWLDMMKVSVDNFGAAAVVGGNEYVFEYADWLLDIPSKDSGYFITDEAVPFYQMVVHGSIPYSGEPVNLFYDPKVQKLKMIEYGYIPFYELTYETPEALKYTDYNELFTSYYEDWIDDAVEFYKELNEKLGDTWNQHIIKHEKVIDDVYKVSYQNGVTVYVNYRKEAIKIDGYQIDGVDYIVVDGGGEIR